MLIGERVWILYVYGREIHVAQYGAAIAAGCNSEDRRNGQGAGAGAGAGAGRGQVGGGGDLGRGRGRGRGRGGGWTSEREAGQTDKHDNIPQEQN